MSNPDLARERQPVRIRYSTLFSIFEKTFFDILDRKYKIEVKYKESKQGRMEDALALRGDEGRDYLR